MVAPAPRLAWVTGLSSSAAALAPPPVASPFSLTDELAAAVLTEALRTETEPLAPVVTRAASPIAATVLLLVILAEPLTSPMIRPPPLPCDGLAPARFVDEASSDRSWPTETVAPAP